MRRGRKEGEFKRVENVNKTMINIGKIVLWRIKKRMNV